MEAARVSTLSGGYSAVFSTRGNTKASYVASQINQGRQRLQESYSLNRLNDVLGQLDEVGTMRLSESGMDTKQRQ